MYSLTDHVISKMLAILFSFQYVNHVEVVLTW